MSRFYKNVSKKKGLPPGTLIHVGDKKVEKVKIEVFEYNEKDFTEKVIDNTEDYAKYKENSTVSWINIIGIHDPLIIEKIGNQLELHQLVLEDIVNTNQRPKLEDYDDYLYIVLKMLYPSKDEVHAEQISIILTKNCVISFQEKEGDVFDGIRERIRKSKGKIRKMKADYLCYALLDAVIDNYFVILEKFGEKIESIEDDLIDNPLPDTLQTIHHMKREMIFLRKSTWPLREVVSILERGESDLIKKQTRIFLRDIYDHTIQVIDTIETFRDMVSGMLDIYLSSVSNKMNEVMKVLTIIATIFIPITFIAGIYGMNFNSEKSIWNMPELNWQYGYLFAWGLMVVVAIIMLLYFRRKKWL